MDGAVQDLTFMLAAVAQSVLRFQVLLAKAGGEEDLRHDAGDDMLEVLRL